jgi:hypothetical protein
VEEAVAAVDVATTIAVDVVEDEYWSMWLRSCIN